MMRSSVVLPQPEAPSSTRNSRSATSRSMSTSAVKPPKRLATSLISISAIGVSRRQRLAMPHMAKRYLRTAKMKISAGSTSAAPPANFSGSGEYVEAVQQERGQGAVADGEHGGGEDLVPRDDEGEDAGGGDAGQRQRQDHLAERLEAGAAERPGRLLQLERDAREEREGDEDGEGQRQRGVDQRQADAGVVEAGADEHHRQRQRQQRQRERRASSAPGGGTIPCRGSRSATAHSRPARRGRWPAPWSAGRR